MRLRRKVIGITLALTLLLTGFVSAHAVIQGDLCTIEAGETITGTVFVLCRALVVDGRVEGNLIGGATIAQINGEVTGGVYLLGGELDVAGTVGEDLHFAGGILHLHRRTRFENERGDLIGASLSTVVDRGVTIPGSIVNVGYQLVLDGTTSGDISFWGTSLTLNGVAKADIDAQVGDKDADPGWLIQTTLSLSEVELKNPGLYVSESGAIEGQLRYTSARQGDILGELANEPQYSAPVIIPAITIGETPSSVGLYLSQVIREFVTLGLIGVGALLLVPRLIQAPIPTLRQHLITSLGIGIPAFFIPLVMVFVVAILTLLFMVVLWFIQLGDLAIVGGLLTGLVSISATSIFYFVAIFLARVIVCLAIGQAIVRSTVGDDGSSRIMYLSLFVGILLLAITASLPAIGWLFNALALVLGLGAILIMVQARLRTFRETLVTPTAPYKRPYMPAVPPTLNAPQQARHLPPPRMEDTPGMENLPEGFEWWDEE
jgi:hypothetical protein